MKCQNMKVGDVLFFIVNLITLYSSSVGQDMVSHQSTIMGNEGKLDRDCPQLLRNIRDNNLTDFTIDCKPLKMKTGVVNEENVLHQACFVVKKILHFVCDNKYTITPDLLKLNVNITCPFNFSHIEFLDFKSNDHKLVVKELTDKEHCSKVCLDLYSAKPQCAVLSQLSNYLKSKLVTQKDMAPSETDKSLQEHNKLMIQNDKSSHVKKSEELEHLVNTKTKAKNETSLEKETNLDMMNKSVTEPMREQKIEKLASTPVEQQMPKEGIKLQDNENFGPGDDDFKSGLEDHNENLSSEDAVGLVLESFSDRSDLGKIDKISASPPKGKEIYSAEGFFQAEDSHFFFYFIMVSSIIVVGYLAFHNKNKPKFFYFWCQVVLWGYFFLITEIFNAPSSVSAPNTRTMQILAYALEGTNARRSRRRPNPARYRKLETNLEEAISSNAVSSAGSNVVY